MDIHGCRALVTGGSEGIGLGIARALLPVDGGLHAMFTAPRVKK